MVSRNISGNKYFGIWLLGPAARSNLVQGNLIGCAPTGRSALGNGDTGVVLENAPNNLVGGTLAGAGNIISGNRSIGALLSGTNARGNLVQGNWIGTDITGTNALGNVSAGLYLLGCPANVIGGSQAGARNLISGNGNSGIYVSGGGACSNVFQGNYIGTDLTGTRSLANGQEGIYILSGSSNLIGGLGQGTGNLISGNASWGLFLTNNGWNVIQGNLIGTSRDGATVLRNGRTIPAANIELGLSHDNVIGGATPGAGNTIAFAPGVYDGVRLRHASSTNNLISGNSIFSNGGLGIDLGLYGVTANDNCDPDLGADADRSGGNLLQNYPVLTAAVAGITLQISGQLNSLPNQVSTLEFFANSGCDPSGNGEGLIFLGQARVGPTNNCTNLFTVALPVQIPTGYTITATATDPANNTSEFSACQPTLPVPALQVRQSGRLSSNQVTLAWTNTMPSLQLFQTVYFGGATPWQFSTNTPILSNGIETVSYTKLKQARFFRLISTNEIAAAVPVLQIRRQGLRDATVSWTNTSDTFLLQEAPYFLIPTKWTLVTNPPLLSNGMMSVNLPRPKGRIFYQLRQP